MLQGVCALFEEDSDKKKQNKKNKKKKLYINVL